ncbi:hypothetical protein V8C86DRAFT_2796564 [Haematococcus lacustris]
MASLASCPLKGISPRLTQRPRACGSSFSCTRFRRHSGLCRVFNNAGGNNEDYGDRALASLPYLLPLLDALPFGKFIFLDYPFVARAMSPLAPLAQLYHNVPFAPFVIFLCVYNGIVNNQGMSRWVRYNAMQAILLDILLIIPQVLLSSLFNNPGSDPLALQTYITAYNTIFLFVAVSVAYGMGASLVGQSARLPLVAEAADKQVNRGPGGF